MQLERELRHPSRTRIQPIDHPPETFNIASFRNLQPIPTLSSHVTPPHELNATHSFTQAALPPIGSVPAAQPYLIPVQAHKLPIQQNSPATQIQNAQVPANSPAKKACNGYVAVAVTIVSLALIGGVVAVVITLTNRQKSESGDTCKGFHCTSGSYYSNDCLPSSFKCDGYSHCHSGEDEQNCLPTSCNGFYCTSGSSFSNCLSSSMRCDGISQCFGGEDEEGCNATCNGFYCTSGSIYSNDCLPSSWHCDDITDCNGGEDEQNCDEDSCSSDEIYCSGNCISEIFECDHITHCSDGKDEEDCDSYCEDRFDCPSGNIFGTYCISKSNVCDGIQHCYDGSDEDDCPDVSCPYNTTACDGNKCISYHQICDGMGQCDDGTDEDDCDEYCHGQFYCSAGSIFGGYCISSTWQCDGYSDCNDNADEENCADLTCNSNQFLCVDGGYHGTCIPAHWECDNINDCYGNTDESHCDTATTVVPSTLFTCPNHSSTNQILKSQVCDGEEHCIGGRDEDACVISKDGGQEDIRVFSVHTLSHHGICAEGWNAVKSIAACNALGFKGFSSMKTEFSNEPGIQCSEATFDLNALVQKYPAVCSNHSMILLTCSGTNMPTGHSAKVQQVESEGVIAKIVGGESVDIEDYPWQVSLQYKAGAYWGHTCGGTIISSKHVITAAHCFEYGRSYRIFAGASELDEVSEGTTYSVTTFTKHPLYSSSTLFLDIAIIKIDETFVFSDSIQPAYLPTSGQVFEDGSTVEVSGWGTLSSGGSSPNELQAVQLPMYNKNACKDNFPLTSHHLLDGMICAAELEGGKDSCQGDSGGPLVASFSSRKTLAGVVSFGIGCAWKGYPGVYTEVGYMTDWIRRRMNDD